MLGVIPDVRAFKFGIDYMQAFGLGIVVKDTSVKWLPARRNRPVGQRSGFDVQLP